MEKITVPSIIDRLYDVMNCADEVMQTSGLDKKQQINVNIAIEEVFVNISCYAYSGCAGDVTVSFSADKNKLVIEFADGGTPFNPLVKPDPDISLPAEKREIGGLGIFMVKKLMDDVSYRYENGKNILTLEKNL
jgi:anti-sigma regulatory factor (Ser/Thr protein kinase)